MTTQPTITIEYDVEMSAAVVTADSSVTDLGWAEIRRVCEEGSRQILLQQNRLVAIPWWSFMLLRGNLRYILKKHALRLEISESAEAFLQKAEQHRRALLSQSQVLTMDERSIQESLNSMGFTRRLTSEQARNISRLLKYPAGASFSVPGAGKTTEALAYFFIRRTPDSKLLIVAPKNAFAAWEEQLQLCLPSTTIRIARLQGGAYGVASALAKDPDFSLISYQQLPNVTSTLASFMAAHPSVMILDESHRMKRGLAGVQGAAVLTLAHLPECKLILSGTPMPNSVGDLVPQFTYLYPMLQTSEDNVIPNVRRIFVRTTKAELGIREPVRLKHEVPMAQAQFRLYESLRSEAGRQLERLSPNERTRLRAFGRSIMRLIQVNTEPALLIRSELSDHVLLEAAIAERAVSGASPKILEACRIAHELARQGHKCIIWSQFVQIVESVADRLSDVGAVYIHGGVEIDDDEYNTDAREAKIKRFHDDPTCMVLVANPAACAEGISLHTVCHHAIYVDRNYNVAQYLQSEDRIHRLGLDPNENTFITVIQTPSSIDDSIQRRLEVKVARMRDVLNDAGLNIEPVHFDEELGFDEGDLADIRRILLSDT